MWLPANAAFAISVALTGFGWPARHRFPRIAEAAREASFVFVLYTVWRLVHRIDLHLSGAHDRAADLWRFQRAIGIGFERWTQQQTLPHSWLTQAANGYYAIAHVPAMIALLVFLFFRRRTSYAHWRFVLAWSTLICVLIRMLPVAPPRLMPELGFVDTAHLYNQSVYGAAGTGVSDQLAAMPSIHVGWAFIVAWALWATAGVRLRWLGLAHLALTIWCITVTANHWITDGIVAIAIVVPIAALSARLPSRNRQNTALRTP
jgi:hypothetical protein